MSGGGCAAWTVAQIADAYDREPQSVYGAEDSEPGAVFDTLADLREWIFTEYGFDPFNEVLGYRLFAPEEDEDPAGPYTLLVTVAISRARQITDWTCPVPAGAGEELTAFVTECRAAAARRAAEAWPLPAAGDRGAAHEEKEGQREPTVPEP